VEGGRRCGNKGRCKPSMCVTNCRNCHGIYVCKMYMLFLSVLARVSQPFSCLKPYRPNRRRRGMVSREMEEGGEKENRLRVNDDMRVASLHDTTTYLQEPGSGTRAAQAQVVARGNQACAAGMVRRCGSSNKGCYAGKEKQTCRELGEGVVGMGKNWWVNGTWEGVCVRWVW